MELLWFSIIAFMLAMYVILDGFDIGAGVLHLIVSKSREDRELLLKTIIPVWDGNEVWLLAAGGTLYFAFPLLYASSFSGFYLPLTMVLWLLMMRGLGIEFRHQFSHQLWKSFWDVVFSCSSILLAIFFGAALGNVVRGVPLNHDGYFFEPLWTTFTIVPNSGILDWFTVLMGVVSLCTLAAHGSFYIAMKTEGEIHRRVQRLGLPLAIAVWLISISAFFATTNIRPRIWDNYLLYPGGYIFPAGGTLGIIGMIYFSFIKKDTQAFLSSSLFIASMLAATAFGLYPNLLPSSINPENSITVYNAAANSYGLNVGLIWWLIGMTLTLVYFTFVYRMFRGKTSLLSDVGY
ncbi:MAG: cytochrome d ubiquinol oxidase subunit II [Bacteroidota bacterium]